MSGRAPTPVGDVEPHLTGTQVDNLTLDGVDRLTGNLRAFGDLLAGRMAPERITYL